MRKISGRDGVAKIQIRVDQGAFQGILQLNLDGRPAGRRPHGQDFALDYYRDELKKYRREHGASDKGFALDEAACRELFDEGSRLYKLEHWLQEAVDSEEFEKAALLRDELKKLREGEG